MLRVVQEYLEHMKAVQAMPDDGKVEVRRGIVDR